MADNETRIKITAVDQASAALGQIAGAAGRVQGAFAALAAIGPIAGLAASISSAINTAAAMDELSQKTGIAVEQLSALDYAMRREGVSTESFGKAVKELSKNMVEAGDATSKTGKLLAELGVNAKGGTREAILQIADTFQKLPDGATKAALATQLFGRAGLDLIPALNNGAEGIRYLEEQARRLGVTLDGDTAKAADKLKDDLFALSESAKALGNSIAKQLVQPLKDITAAMREAVEQGGLLQALWVGLGGIGNLIINGTEIQQARGEVEKLTETIARLEEAVGKAEGKGVDNLIKALDELNPKLEAAKNRLKDLTTAPAVAPASGGDKVLENRLAAALRAGAGGTKAAVDTFGRELEALQLRLEATSAGFSAEFPKAVAIFSAALASGRIDLEKHAELMALLIAQQPAFKAGMEAEAKSVERRNQLLRESQQEEVDAINSRDAVLDRLERGNAQLAGEVEALGENAYARERYLLKLEEELDLKEALTPEDETRIRNLYREREALLAAKEAREEQLSVWSDVADRGSRFFADLVLNGKDAFEDLKRSLKSFAAELIALFAKRWILQLGASLTGNSALGALAGNVGQGSFAGAILGNAGGILAGGANALGLGGFSQFIGGASGAIAGPALPGSALAAGQGFGGALAAAGPYIAAAIAAYMLYKQFADKGENWRGRIGFGDQANAYSVDGVFGREGFQYIAGQDATNRALQAFFGSTQGIDRQLSGQLTESQRASISEALLRYNTSGRRNDGQPAEFAFGKDDDTAAAQLTLEYLQQKYGAVFDEIDTEFAAFIRGYTGKSEDLLKAIADYASVVSQIDSLGIKGFNLEALKAFKQEGESLGDALARVAQQWSQYQDVFLSDAEKLALAQERLSTAFADLGVEMPATNEEFRRLVESLDLSTEAGRTLFAALMQLAPAFAGVTAAANAMLGQFRQVVASRNPTLNRELTERDLEVVVRQFMERNPWTSGMDWRAVASQINLLPTFAGGQTDFARYSPEDQALILRILGLSDDLDGLGDAASGAANALTGAGRSFAEIVGTMRDVKRSLWDFLRGLYTSEEFSPLDPTQRLDTLKSRFTTAIASANNGNIGSALELPTLIEEILKLGRENFASGPGYTDLFDWVTRLAGDFVQPGGGAELSRLAYEEQRRQTNLMADVRALLISIRDGGTADGKLVASTVTNAALSTERR